MRKTVFTLLVAILSFAAMARPEMTTDYSNAKVYVATNATIPEIEAAKLVIRTIEMVAGRDDPGTNAAPSVASALPADRPAIVIGWQGSDLVKPFAKVFELKGWKENGGVDVIVQTAQNGILFLAGNSPEGAFYSAADFLYYNGARSLHVGTREDNWDGGTFLEYVTDLKGPEDNVLYRYSPLVRHRSGFALNKYLPKEKVNVKNDEWIRRNHFAIFNGTEPKGPMTGNYGRLYQGSECIQPAYNDFHKTPDYFPMVDGKRWRPAPDSGWCWVVEGCWSSAGFTQWVIDRVTRLVRDSGESNQFGLDITNSDGGRSCDCPECVKLRASYPDISSCYFDYQRKLIQGVKKTYPGLHVESLAYIMSRNYPKMGNEVLSEQDAIDYCPYSRCYIHRYDDPTCPTNKKDLDRMAEWKKANLPIGDFDYSFDVFHPSMSLPTWELTAEIVTYWKVFNGELGIPRIYAESATADGGNGGKSRISAYVFARTMWDDSISPDELLQDYCRVGYGKAGDVMLAYHRACAVAWTNQPAHLTSTFNNPLGTAKSYMTPALQKIGIDAFQNAKVILRAEIVANKDNTRESTLLKKQLATLLYEERLFQDWLELNKKATATSMQINVEEAADDPKSFDSMEKVYMKKKEGGEDLTRSYGQFFRTKDSICVRITSHGPIFKKTAWKEDRTDSNKSYEGNSMEFFVQAPGRSDYYQFAVSSEGFHYDGRCLDGSFNSDLWKTSSKSEDGWWELTLKIPYALFDGYEPKAGDVFKFIAINNSQILDNRNEPKLYAVGIPYPEIGRAHV